MHITLKILPVILLAEIILVICIIFSSFQYNLDGIGLFIWSVLGMLIIYPAALVVNMIALHVSKNKYLYMPLAVNISGALGLLMYIILFNTDPR